MIGVPEADQMAILKDLATNLHDEPERYTCEVLSGPAILVWVVDGRAAALTRECAGGAWNYRDVDGRHRRWVPSPATIARIEELERVG